jgi:methylenetetrahydrofolate reductase (NADPH)
MRTFPASVSIEVTTREKDVAAKLRGGFPPGMRVHVTFLRGDALAAAEEACIAVRRAGFDPVPHLAARNFRSAAQLDSHLARLSGEAGVERALVIAGDIPAPRGPFGASLDLMRTDLLRRHGLRALLLAGHPEGHPAADRRTMAAALRDKLAFAAEAGFPCEIVTQFCFESGPVAGWLGSLRASGTAAPVRIGMAGPASLPALVRFARRCGIGNSARVLRTRGAALARLADDGIAGRLLGDLARDVGDGRHGCVSGIHLYTFGGLERTARWLATLDQWLSAGTVRSSAL